MSYRAEEAARKRTTRRVKIVLCVVLSVLLVGLSVFSCFYPPSTWKYYVALPHTEKRVDGECRLHFLDVGQGDGVLIELPDGKTMLVDGGDTAEEHTAYIIRYIHSLGIDRLNYLVATHPDTDHTGGLSKIVEVVGTEIAYVPAVEESENAAYAEFLSALKEAGSAVIVSERGLSLSVQTGETPYTLWFLSPYGADNPAGEYAEAEKENASSASLNDISAVIWIDYFGSSALLCGDITAEKEADLLRDATAGLITFGEKTFTFSGTEILKVSHHGSKYSSSAVFLNALGVKDAVISVGADNSYSHPAEETCQRLTSAGAEIWRTDEHGTVVATLRKNGTYKMQSYPTAA